MFSFERRHIFQWFSVEWDTNLVRILWFSEDSVLWLCSLSACKNVYILHLPKQHISLCIVINWGRPKHQRYIPYIRIKTRLERNNGYFERFFLQCSKIPFVPYHFWPVREMATAPDNCSNFSPFYFNATLDTPPCSYAQWVVMQNDLDTLNSVSSLFLWVTFYSLLISCWEIVFLAEKDPVPKQVGSS